LLQDETVSGGHGMRRYSGKKRTYRDQYLGPFIKHEMNRCIHCYRCSRFYQQFAGYRDLGPQQIGNRVYFGRFEDGRLESPFSGNLVDICPTGVYTDKTARFKVRRWDLRRSPSLCVHCSLGCNTIANSHYRAVMRIEARHNKDVNGYFICDRGRFGFSYANGGKSHEARPWNPRVDGRDTTAAEALSAAAEKLSGLARSSGAVASIGSTRSSLETMAMLKRFCKASGLTGPAYFPDSAQAAQAKRAVARLDARLAVSLGDIEEADLVIAVGVDPINEAPMLALAMRQVVRKEGHVVVIDPRPVELPMAFAHLSVAPGDMEAALGMIVRTSLDDAARLGSQTAAYLKSLPSEYAVEEKIGNAIPRLAETLRNSKKTVIVCGTALGSETLPDVAADLALLLGDVKDRVGLFCLLPGANGFAGALLDEGQSVADTVRRIEEGSVKGLIVVENDIFLGYPDRERLQKALDRLEFLMVLDYLPTEAVARANVFLPTSNVFEVDSTYINNEGRVQTARRCHFGGVPIWGDHPARQYGTTIPGGEHRPAWDVLARIGKAMGNSELDADNLLVTTIPALSSSDGMDGKRIVPDRSEATPFASKIGAGGESRQANDLEVIMADRTFGTDELSAYSDTLNEVKEEPFICMHRADAALAGLEAGDRVALRLDRGSIDAKLILTDNMARGVVVLPRLPNGDWRVME
ncbi:MAG: molybdopterin-dependent oxidoreductase, partial [Acidobacteriota bacterium]